MKKYIVKIDRHEIAIDYYEIEAESEEEALCIAAHDLGELLRIAAHDEEEALRIAGEKRKFLFDENVDEFEGKPEIERRPIEIVRREAAESKCCFDLSTGLYIGLDCDEKGRILSDEESEKNIDFLLKGR